MDIHARHIAVHGRHKQLLPPTSFRIAEGQLALVRCLQEEATAFALALSGRIEPDDGAVLLDGEGNDARLRAQVALVDSPRVTEPEPSLPLAGVVAEALSLAGHPSGKLTVREWLEEHHAGEYAQYRFETLPAPLRTRLLVELAVIPPEVRVLVLDTPDRHTGDAHTWWTVALRQAQRGLAVVVLCSEGSARSLPVDAAKVGQMQQPAPITVSVDGVHIADVPPSDPSMGTQYGDAPEPEFYGDRYAPEYHGGGGYADDYPHEGYHYDDVFDDDHDDHDDHDAEDTEDTADAEESGESSEETTMLPVIGDQQYGEHHYSDVDFAEQERLDPQPASTGISARLNGSPSGNAEAEADDAADDGSGDGDTTGTTASTDVADSEETTTLQRVSDREDSPS